MWPFDQVWKAATSVVSTVTKTVSKAVSTVATVATKAVATVTQAVESTVVAVAQTTQQVTKGLGDAINSGLETVRSTGHAVIDAVGTVVPGVAPVLSFVWEGANTLVKYTVGQVANFALNTVDTVVSTAAKVTQQVAHGVREGVDTLFEAVANNVAKLMADPLSALRDAANGLVKAGQNLLDGLGETLVKLRDVAVELVNDVREILTDVHDSLSSGDVLKAVTQLVLEPFSTLLGTTLKTLDALGPLSKAALEFMDSFVPGVRTLALDMAKSIVDTLDGAADVAVDFINSLSNATTGSLADLADNYARHFGANWVTDALKQLANLVDTVVFDLPKLGLSAVPDFMKWLINLVEHGTTHPVVHENQLLSSFFGQDSQDILMDAMSLADSRHYADDEARGYAYLGMDHAELGVPRSAQLKWPWGGGQYTFAGDLQPTSGDWQGPQVVVRKKVDLDGKVIGLHVNFVPTNSPSDFKDEIDTSFGKLVYDYLPILKVIRQYAISHGLDGSDILVSGYSLGGAITNSLHLQSGHFLGGFFAGATYVGGASPFISPNAKAGGNILNIGAENDPVYGWSGQGDQFLATIQAFTQIQDQSLPNAMDNLFRVTKTIIENPNGNMNGVFAFGNWDAHAIDAPTPSTPAPESYLSDLINTKFFNEIRLDDNIVMGNLDELRDINHPTNSHYGQAAYFIGGSADQHITASSHSDAIDAGAGNDKVYAGAGHDRIYGGKGNDVVYGQAGNDTMWGGDGNDTLEGGEGHDRLMGEDGDDLLRGGAGNDVLVAGKGRDLLNGDAGHDVLVFTQESRDDGYASRFNGGAGFDTLQLRFTAGAQFDMAEVPWNKDASFEAIERIDLTASDPITLTLSRSDVLRITDRAASKSLLVIDGNADDVLCMSGLFPAAQDGAVVPWESALGSVSGSRVVSGGQVTLSLCGGETQSYWVYQDLNASRGFGTLLVDTELTRYAV